MNSQAHKKIPPMLYSVVTFPTNVYIICEFCATHWTPLKWQPEHEHNCQGLTLKAPADQPTMYCGNCGTLGQGKPRRQPHRSLEAAIGGKHHTNCADCIIQTVRDTVPAVGT